MKRIAVIAAAGWKAAGDSSLCPSGAQEFLKPLESCPNALLPIGGGKTILSRLADQLTGLGFEVWVGVGKPGCRYEGWVSRLQGVKYLRGTITDEAFALGKTKSPWTRERVEYVPSFAKTVAISNPDKHNCFHTYWSILQKTGSDWDRLLMMHGDTLLRIEVLKKAVGKRPPCVYVLTRLHDIFWFDRKSMPLFLKVIRKVLSIPKTPGNQVVDSLKRSGVPIIEHGPYPSDDWCDVDYPRSLPSTETGRHEMSYERALGWVKNERGS